MGYYKESIIHIQDTYFSMIRRKWTADTIRKELAKQFKSFTFSIGPDGMVYCNQYALDIRKPDA